jgi:hypothetical protein
LGVTPTQDKRPKKTRRRTSAATRQIRVHGKPRDQIKEHLLMQALLIIVEDLQQPDEPEDDP